MIIGINYLIAREDDGDIVFGSLELGEMRTLP